MSKSTDNWMEEKDGVPHKDGKVRWYLIGLYEDVYGYLGWYDMTDWDEGWKKVWESAEKKCPSGEFQVLRHDQLMDLKRNIDNAFEEAMEVKGETTWVWWYQQEKKAKGEMK
jgi:hypothetical protein